MSEVRTLAEHVPDYAAVLADLATALQQIAVVQLAGADALDPDADGAQWVPYADRLDPELVQLFYEIACTGRRDIGLAPEPGMGFEMVLLRMLAFAPRGEGIAAPKREAPVAPARPAPQSSAPPAAAPAPEPAAVPAPEPAASPATNATRAAAVGKDDWLQLVGQLGLSGMAGQLAQNCALTKHDGALFEFVLEKRNEHLLTNNIKGRLQQALSKHFGIDAVVTISLGKETKVDTVASRAKDEVEQQVSEARMAIRTDPQVQDFVALFDATVDEDSIVPTTGQNDQ